MISPDSALLSMLGRTIRKQRLLQPDDTIVVAISGGADSTALLDLLSRLPGYNLHLIAAHLNHCLRGNDSDADEDFCRQLAARYKIPFESGRVDVRGLAESWQLNLEDAGRRARITFLDELREKYVATVVALAHHADDQAETILMRLLRGSGMTGLSGMEYRNARNYIRPLLEITRDNIEEYLLERKLTWREDASNSDKAYLRNRIRHELLPLLEEYNPAIRSCLVATSSILSDDESLLGELTERAFGEACRIEGGKIVCRIEQLRMLNPALLRRVLRHAFKLLAGTLERMSRRHIDAISSVIDSDRPNSRLDLPQRVKAVREYNRLLLKQSTETIPETVPDLLIKVPGYYPLPEFGSLKIGISVPPASLDTLPADTVFLDLGKFPFPWRVRTFLPGDRIIPFGMNGRKKVKDIFIDRKIPLSERKRIPLLFCGTDLIWVAGVCVSELCRINTPHTASVQVRWQA